MKKFIVLATSLFLWSSAAQAQAITCGLADDTPTAQAVINAGLPLLLPPGNCNITSLNVTNKMGAWISGFGLLSQIIPIQNGANVIDLTGSSNATLKNFRICGACNFSVTATIGILAAQNSSAYSSDALQIDHVRVDGKFNTAALYNLQVASSHVTFSQFYNYQNAGMVVVMTGNNLFSAVSTFATINNANNYAPSDWTFDQVEIHDLSGNGVGLWVGGMNSMRVYGGNISSSHQPVSWNAVIINGVASYPAFNLFDGTTFYNDFPPTPARAITNNAGPASAPIMRANQTSSPLF